MTSMASAAVGAIVTKLGTAPAVSPNIYRVRLRPLGQATTSAIVVRPMQAEAADETLMFSGLPVSWTTAISVEIYARSSVATTPDVAVDSLVESVYARLMADPTLGGVVLGLACTAISWDFDADGDQTTCVTLTLYARQRSPGATLS